jgi:hypothetical protein
MGFLNVNERIFWTESVVGDEEGKTRGEGELGGFREIVQVSPLSMRKEAIQTYPGVDRLSMMIDFAYLSNYTKNGWIAGM